MKNKVAPPFKSAEFDIMFGEGISKIGEIIDIGVDANIITKSGSWFSYEGTKLGQGRDTVKALLKDNPELAEEIEAKIREFLKNNDLSDKPKKGKKATSKIAKEEDVDDDDQFDDDDDYNDEE